MKALLATLLVLMALVHVDAQTTRAEASALADSLANDTVNWQSMARLARYYRDHYNTRKALLWTERAYAIHPSDTIKRDLAHCLYSRGKYQRCLDICHQLLTPTEANPQPDSSSLYLMTRCFKELQLTDSLIDYQVLTAQYDIENQANLISMSKNLIAIKQTKLAVYYLDQYYAIDSTSTNVNAARAFAYYSLGHPRKAISLYEKVIADGLETSDNYYYLGMAYNQRGHEADALMCFQRANELTDSTSWQILTRLAISELNFSDTAADGLRHADMAVELMQPSDDALLSLYYSKGVYFTNKDTREALRNFHEADKAKPDDKYVQYNLGYCYHMLENDDKAAHYFQKYLDLVGPEDDSSLTNFIRDRINKIKEKQFMKGELAQDK